MAPTRKAKTVKRYSNLSEASPGGKNKQGVSLILVFHFSICESVLCELLDVLFHFQCIEEKVYRSIRTAVEQGRASAIL